MNVPCSPTPAGPPRSATAALWCCLPPNGRRRLPRQILISGLNHAARLLTVYASQSGLLHRHARLASGWLAGLSGRDWATRWVPTKGFRSSHPPFPSFTWRTHFTVSKSHLMGANLAGANLYDTMRPDRRAPGRRTPEKFYRSNAKSGEFSSRRQRHRTATRDCDAGIVEAPNSSSDRRALR
jgi:hypothetical protein